MVAVFGFGGPQHESRTPYERLVEAHPMLDVFALRRAGLLAEAAQWVVDLGTGDSLPATRRAGILELGGQEIPIRSHRTLPMEVFGCPKCDRDCYRLHFVDRLWRCRTCPPKLDYVCRHRQVPGLSRIGYLRRRLHASLTLFSPLPARRGRKHMALCREVRRLEAALLAHARDDIVAVLEKRYARRFGR